VDPNSLAGILNTLQAHSFYDLDPSHNCLRNTSSTTCRNWEGGVGGWCVSAIVFLY